MSKPRPRKIICKWCGHSKSITKDLEVAYRKGRADAIDEFADKLLEELAHTTLLKDGYYLANIIKPLAEQLRGFEK